MTNDDLKRFYNVNDKPEQNKDFVRYGSNGEIISEHDATKDKEVVNYRTLMQHTSGGNDKLYTHNINYKVGFPLFNFIIINKSNSPMTATQINEYLKTHGKIPVTYMKVTDYSGKNDSVMLYYGIESSSTTPIFNTAKFKAEYNDSKITFISSSGSEMASSSSFTDTVVEI